MEKSKLMEILSTAMDTEADGYVFYTRAADMVGDAKGKDVFKRLAGEEIVHFDVMAALAESVRKGRQWPDYAEAKASGLAMRGKGGLPAFRKDSALMERLEGVQGDLDVLEMAIEIEDEAVAFYSDMLRDASAPEEKVLLSRIIDIERHHLKVLRWEHESLSRDGFWCGYMEYSVEKEAN